MNRRRKFYCTVCFSVAVCLACLVLLLTAARVSSAPRTVRVGIYQNAPKIFLDEKGQAAGLFIELLEKIAAVLIVDDHEQNRYLLRTLLTALGYRTLEAAHGTEALELARRAHPDLIISDILMPQMDGFALCRECKRDEALRDIPFVFYTATYTDPRDEALAMQLGAARFIVKPIANEEFIAILREVLQAHQAGQLPSSQLPLEEEMVFYRLYNEALIRKLEDKMLELEQTNRRLAEQLDELRRWYQVTLGREERIRELKHEVNELLRRLGEPIRYPSAEDPKGLEDLLGPLSKNEEKIDEL